MEKIQGSICTPKGLCERIRTKITSTPAPASSIQPSPRPTSRVPQLFMAPPQHFPLPARTPSDEKNKKVSGSTPIQFESSVFATTSHKVGGGGNTITNQLDADSSNNRFTDFIKRARFKFRTTSDVGTRVPKTSSDVGSGKRISRLDSVNERVSDYIKRAKGKMGKTFKGRD